MNPKATTTSLSDAWPNHVTFTNVHKVEDSSFKEYESIHREGERYSGTGRCRGRLWNCREGVILECWCYYGPQKYILYPGTKESCGRKALNFGKRVLAQISYAGFRVRLWWKGSVKTKGSQQCSCSNKSK